MRQQKQISQTNATTKQMHRKQITIAAAAADQLHKTESWQHQ
jgi:hypothetical protein